MERINERIFRIMQHRRMSIAELGRRIDRSPSSIHAMLKRKTVKVSLLTSICKALEYNFFRELAENHQYKDPVIGEDFKEKSEVLSTELEQVKQTLSKLQEKNNELENKLQQTEKQVTILHSKTEVYKEVIENIGKV